MSEPRTTPQEMRLRPSNCIEMVPDNSTQQQTQKAVTLQNIVKPFDYQPSTSSNVKLNEISESRGHSSPSIDFAPTCSLTVSLTLVDGGVVLPSFEPTLATVEIPLSQQPPGQYGRQRP